MLAAVVLTAAPAGAVEPIQLTGALVGLVTDNMGVPQMGAAVSLFNRYDRLVARVLTSDKGTFLFDSINPELYSVRVSLTSFVPAVKRQISILPGVRSYLAINLSSVLSSVELVYMAPGQSPIMSEDWKWVLRSSAATRPVLRMLPGTDISDPSRRRPQQSAVFSGTRGVVKVSAGDGGAVSAAGNQPDLGTAFALATSLFGGNHLQFSGNLGYASHSGIPTAGFRTSFSRDQAGGDSPRLNVTMRQVFLPTRAGAGILSGRSGDAPVLRTMTVSSVDRQRIGDDLELVYGGSLESVSFLNRLNYVSPFARLRWGDVKLGALEVAFSSGAPATELLEVTDAPDAELQHQLSTLAIFPRVSLRGGQARVQRTQNFEIGYRRAVGSRSVTVGLFRESVTNAAFTMAAPAGYLPATELLPDLGSNSSIFNAGDYRRAGYHASFTQSFDDLLSATLAYGYGGALESQRPRLATNSPDEIRGLMRRVWRNSLALRLSGTAPRVGTRYAASYQWTDYSVLHPVHLSLIQRSTVEPGLNIHLRQPIPGVTGVFPGRFEATAELRNLLAQGYLPLATSDGRQVVLIHAPKSVRGGLSFIF
jgi:hypothetical protein